MSADIRKIAVWVEETHREIGQTISPPTRKAVAVAVIQNPFAGSYSQDLSPLMDIGAELGGLLGDKCVAGRRRAGTRRRHLAPKAWRAIAQGRRKRGRTGAVFEKDGRTGAGA